MKFLIVGAGLSGSILAKQLAERGKHSITIIEKRDHIGGNCYTYKDAETGAIVHAYGAHIFNSPSQTAIQFFSNHLSIKNYTHRVRAILPNKGVYSLPINLHTINQFFGKTYSPSEAETFLRKQAIPIESPSNFEEQALSMIGPELYEAFFRGYTVKQWGVDPKELPASILKRLPVRFNYDDSYYHSGHSSMPSSGYTPMFERLLKHPSIEVHLETEYSHSLSSHYNHTFFTGPIDYYFNYKHGRLGYRTVYWKNERHDGDYQGNSVNNYPQLEQPYTRILEHKHFTPWNKLDKTLISYEYSKETGDEDEPYYPKRLMQDVALLQKYVNDAHMQDNVSFLGRLGTYRYLDMWKVADETLLFAKQVISCLASGTPLPRFSSDPIHG
jgi:UDP-galactopyranose mutase